MTLRADIQRQYDSVIPVNADNLAPNPSGQTPERLLSVIKWAVSDLEFYQGDIDRLDQELATVLADREGLAAEWDRKTRHADAIRRQRDHVLTEPVGAYRVLLKAAIEGMSDFGIEVDVDLARRAARWV